jgi:glycosyltransferase involved in cell wall biosynthesis
VVKVKEAGTNWTTKPPAKILQPLHRFLGPRLGLLYHYPPKPLHIPGHYESNELPTTPPTISLVTPSFNQAGFLEQTIQSVISQNYPCLEYIVQDGASSDDTASILARYAAQLTRWVSAPDTGQANAINLGFAQTGGALMAWLNADDLLLPGALHYIAHFFATHPEVDVVYGHRVLIDQNNAEIGRWVLPPHDNRILFWNDYIPQETLFWRRRIWEKTGAQVDESYRFALDWELLLRFQAAGAKFVRLPRFLAAFRVHPAQKTSTQLADTGRQEKKRLREQYHGRPVSRYEIGRHTWFYLTRSMINDWLYRLGLLRY